MASVSKENAFNTYELRGTKVSLAKRTNKRIKGTKMRYGKRDSLQNNRIKATREAGHSEGKVKLNSLYF